MDNARIEFLAANLARTVTGGAGESRGRLKHDCGRNTGGECKSHGEVYESCFHGRIPPETRNLTGMTLPERQRISVTVVTVWWYQ